MVQEDSSTYAEHLIKRVSEEFKEKEFKENEKKIQSGIKEDEKFIKWLSDLSKDDVSIVGGKGANLAEIYNLGLPVPPAFVITAQAFEYFLRYNNIVERIHEMIRDIDINNTSELESKAKEIQELIINVEIPADLKEEIIEAYKNLNIDLSDNVDSDASSDALAILRAGREPCFVAVRSSATTEDLSSASFAGQQETFLNIKGNIQLIEAVKRCFASLFTARAIYYREKKGFEHEKSFIAVVVQRMINSEKSGVIFTVNPAGNEEEMIIEAVFGLGEGIVSGAIKPDQYVLEKKSLKLKSKSISKKEVFFTRTAAGKTIKQLLHESKQNVQVLSEYELTKLGNYAIKIEEHYKHPQDIEFAIESNNIYIVQTRPITTLAQKHEVKEIEGEVVLQGLIASPGIASGVVKIVKSMDDLNKVQQGDILVTKMTNPDMVVTMQRASAIITDEGGATAHAAIVSREMGIPCVVGTKTATTSLQDGEAVTVNGFTGKVYRGILAATEKVKIESIIKTKTEIKVIIDLPAFAERTAETHANGVGLLRLEGIIASAEKHPLQYLRENKTRDYKDLLLEGIKKIVEHFPTKPVWIRTSDIRSDEFQHLKGSPRIETNPMLGMHGIRASLKYPELLKAELQAVKEIAEQNFLVGVMLPQLISVEELKEVKKLFTELDIPDSVELGVMIETPAAVQIIGSLCKEGIDFISFGTNDLTQYTLAIDRGNEELQQLYNEMHPAVLSQLAYVIKTCKQYNVKTSICGQAGSKPEMARWLVMHGIDSISVNADAAYDVTKIVAEVESEIEKQVEREVPEQVEEERKEKEQEKEETETELKKEERDKLVEIKRIEEEAEREIAEIEKVEELRDKEDEKLEAEEIDVSDAEEVDIVESTSSRSEVEEKQDDVEIEEVQEKEETQDENEKKSEEEGLDIF
jgi:pyruvate,water dikinase